MFRFLQILTVILVAVAMALSLAHALELPGKMRLDEETYRATQRIYYPGFTIGGVSEPASTILMIVLLFLRPIRNVEFWLTLLSLVALIGMQLVYWLFTHPINRFWVTGAPLNQVSDRFFSFGAKSARESEPRTPKWTELRDRWEYSHVVRAVLGLLSLFGLIVAISCSR